MGVEVIADAAGLDALTPEWTALLQAAETEGVFMEPDWVTTWWRVYGDRVGGRLHVVGVRDRDGALTGVAPLYLDGAGTLRFLGTGGDTSPDFLTVIARGGREAAVAEELAEHLYGPDAPPWDAMLLTDLAADEPMTDVLTATIGRRARGLSGVRSDAICPVTTLAHSVEAHRAGLPKHLRRLQARRRQLERDRGLRWFLWTEEQGIAAGIERLAALHRLRFTDKGSSHSFGSPEYLAFHTAVAARFAARGMLRLYALEIDGVVASMLYCFRRGDALYYFQSGFDPAFTSAGVGQALLSYALEHAIGEGVRRYEFLKGDYSYKGEWATARRRTVRLCAARPTLRGVRVLAREHVRPAAGALLRAAGREIRTAAREPAGAAPRLRAALGLRPDHGARHLVKYALGATLYHTGLMRGALRLLRLVDRQPRLVALAYHRVLPSDVERGGVPSTVEAANFERQARVIARLFDTPAPDAALAALQSPPARWGRYPALVTFDDGFENVGRYAWPILRRHGLPLVLFVPTGLVGADRFLWADEVTRLIMTSSVGTMRLSFRGEREDYRLGDEASRAAVALKLKARLKTLAPLEFAAQLEAIRAAAGGGAPRHTAATRFHSWGELRRLARQGVVMAAHTHDHPVLARVPVEAQRFEVRESQHQLEARLGVRPRLFAYPNGYEEDIGPSSVAEVEGAGFTHSFTMMSRVANGGDDRLLLPRIAPEDEPGVMLGLELLRVLARAVLRPGARVAAKPTGVTVSATAPSAPAPAAAPPPACDRDVAVHHLIAS